MHLVALHEVGAGNPDGGPGFSDRGAAAPPADTHLLLELPALRGHERSGDEHLRSIGSPGGTLFHR